MKIAFLLVENQGFRVKVIGFANNVTHKTRFSMRIAISYSSGKNILPILLPSIVVLGTKSLILFPIASYNRILYYCQRLSFLFRLWTQTLQPAIETIDVGK